MEEFKRTEYVDQVRVASSNDGKLVTGSVVMTRGFWHDCPMPGQATRFCVIDPKAPAGLPIVDESKPIGALLGEG